MENNNGNNIQKLLGRRIQEFRKKKGLTQGRLAEMVGIGERNLSKIECGQSFVTSKTVSKILAKLEVEPEEIFNFNHLKNTNDLKKEMVDAIENDMIDINLLYQLYKSIR